MKTFNFLKAKKNEEKKQQVHNKVKILIIFFNFHGVAYLE